jgi:hypothetical protein
MTPLLEERRGARRRRVAAVKDDVPVRTALEYSGTEVYVGTAAQVGGTRRSHIDYDG